MSWIEFRGRPWRTTDSTADLRLHLGPADSAAPRQRWVFDLMHSEPEPDEPHLYEDRHLFVEIDHLHLALPDWRRLAGLEIRADSAWHLANDCLGEYGRAATALVTVSLHHKLIPGAQPHECDHRQWLAHDFILRFGALDGLSVSCELDAWLIPEPEYYRREPEPLADTARFAEGPPDLRLITSARFTEGSVRVPRCADPVAWAREALASEVACTHFHDPSTHWAVRFDRAHADIEPMPGWTSTVRYRTEPRPPA